MEQCKAILDEYVRLGQPSMSIDWEEQSWFNLYEQKFSFHIEFQDLYTVQNTWGADTTLVLKNNTGSWFCIPGVTKTYVAVSTDKTSTIIVQAQFKEYRIMLG